MSRRHSRPKCPVRRRSPTTRHPTCVLPSWRSQLAGCCHSGLRRRHRIPGRRHRMLRRYSMRRRHRTRRRRAAPRWTGVHPHPRCAPDATAALLLGLLRDMHAQHAVLEIGLDLLRVGPIRQLHAPQVAAATAFHHVVVLLLALRIALRLGRDGEHVVVDLQIDVGRLHAGQVGFDAKLVVLLVHVQPRHRDALRAAGEARRQSDAAKGVVEETVHLAVQVEERIDAREAASGGGRNQESTGHRDLLNMVEKDCRSACRVPRRGADRSRRCSPCVVGSRRRRRPELNFLPHGEPQGVHSRRPIIEAT